MKSLHTILAVILANTLIYNCAQALTTYKWMDKDGSVHYTQHPPAEGVPFEKIQTRGPSSSSGKSSVQTQSAKDSILQDKANQDANDLVENEMTKNEGIRKDNCEKAKKNLQFYQLSRRWKDKEGNIKSLEENERQAKLEKAKQDMKDYCN